MRQLLARFWGDELGAEMVEWAVVTIVLLGFTAFIIIMIQDELKRLLEQVFEALQRDPPDQY